MQRGGEASALDEGRPGVQWHLALLLVHAVDDLPDHLLGPGGPALGERHDPDVVFTNREVVEPVSDSAERARQSHVL